MQPSSCTKSLAHPAFSWETMDRSGVGGGGGGHGEGGPGRRHGNSPYICREVKGLHTLGTGRTGKAELPANTEPTAGTWGVGPSQELTSWSRDAQATTRACYFQHCVGGEWAILQQEQRDVSDTQLKVTPGDSGPSCWLCHSWTGWGMRVGKKQEIQFTEESREMDKNSNT